MAERPVYRPSRSSGMDPTTRRLATIAGGMGAALVAVVGGYTLVKGGHGGGGGIPVIAPPPGPLKVKPANPGGLQVLGAEPPPSADGTTAETLAPGPEKADPQALAAALARARTPAAPTPVPASRTATTAVPSTAGMATPPAPVLPTTAAPPAQAAAQAVALPAPESAGVSAGAAGVAAPAGGRITVQLGALASEAEAHEEWHRLSARGAALFDGRTLAVMPVQHEGRTLWRIRTGGFASVAEANAFCVRARALGGACNVATF